MLTVYLLSRHTAELPYSKFTQVADRCTLLDESPEFLEVFLCKEEARQALSRRKTNVLLYRWSIGNFFSVEEFSLKALSFPDCSEQELSGGIFSAEELIHLKELHACTETLCDTSELNIHCLESGYDGQGHIETNEEGRWFWCMPSASPA